MNRGYNINSAYHDESMDKWIDDVELTHPYIAMKVSHINPNSLQEISHTIDLKVMADTGAMCSIVAYVTPCDQYTNKQINK